MDLFSMRVALGRGGGVGGTGRACVGVIGGDGSWGGGVFGRIDCLSKEFLFLFLLPPR
jgi:hypothetical protein